MKKRLKQYGAMYFNSFWIPTTAFIVVLGLFHCSKFFFYSYEILTILMLCIAIGLVGIFIASIWNFSRKAGRAGTVNMTMFFVCGYLGLRAFGYWVIASIFGPSEDGFADGLTIPGDIEIVEPIDALEGEATDAVDHFQEALAKAACLPGSNESTVNANISSLSTLYSVSPKILIQYFATSPSWRVFKENGNLFATRRWLTESGWRYSPHGYYSTFFVETNSNDELDFQFRFTVGLDGRPWWLGDEDSTWINAGNSRIALLTMGNQLYGSHCVVSADKIAVEILEQSSSKERRLTNASIAYLDMELAPLVAEPSFNKIRELCPTDSIKNGKPVFELLKAFQVGIYKSIIWLNPGEPGMLFLKAFEVSRESPLSVERLKEKSNEWVGWSTNPEELFYSNTRFKIYEGDWGKPYAARFEIWFTPDSGKADRKLLEKVFKIEGWQR